MGKEGQVKIVNQILRKEHGEGCLARQVDLRGLRCVIRISREAKIGLFRKKPKKKL